MTTLLDFTVHGEPQPQGSKTVARSKSGATHVREDNPDTQPWRNAVAAAARAAMLDTGADGVLLAGPLRLVAAFTFGRPRSHFGTGRNAGRLKPSAPTHCDKRPDLDKLVRAIGDALTGTAVVDDAAVVELVATKRYGSPACRITLKAASS